MMSTKGKKKGALVPHLRFPEFRDAGEWEEKALKAVCSMQAGKFVAASDIFVCYNDNLYPCYGGNGLRGYTATYTHSGKFPLIGRQGALCGNIKMGNGQFHATEHAVVVSPISDIQVNFLFYLLNLLNLNRFATGQAQPGLSVDVIGNISAPIPEERSEQQLIADCLFSLDESIAAEAKKLDALKAHKKGLLKQLFPAEGETLPALRFPEFQDAGEWERVQLGSQTAKVGSGVTPRGGDKNYLKKGRPFIRSQNVGWGELILDDVAFISEDIHGTFSSTEIKNSDVLLNITGASIGRCAFADERIVGGNVNQHVCIIRTKSKTMNCIFLMQYILSEYGQNQIDSFQAGGNRQGLNFVQIKSFSIPIPPRVTVKPHGCPEQQRIADCLSSLDELISAQTQKIELLKSHKKGLMQQLFPVVDEAKA